MMRMLKRAAMALAAGSLLVGAVGCDEASLALAGYDPYYDGGGYGGDYYYGWYEDGSTASFSLSPGIDAGDSLETYLGSFVSY